MINKDKVITLKIIYGSYDSDGNWHHNPLLDMSRSEQLECNMKNENFKLNLRLK